MSDMIDNGNTFLTTDDFMRTCFGVYCQQYIGIASVGDHFATVTGENLGRWVMSVVFKVIERHNGLFEHMCYQSTQGVGGVYSRKHRSIVHVRSVKTSVTSVLKDRGWIAQDCTSNNKVLVHKTTC